MRRSTVVWWKNEDITTSFVTTSIVMFREGEHARRFVEILRHEGTPLSLHCYQIHQTSAEFSTATMSGVDVTFCVGGK